ncbi:MAG: hypothetical protein G8237_09625 [Magnetococcales bacterium]|nr:hypothetical protein [Magnetococcales bacterium]NGZ06604.1 hypothetical protein [Magnetococcales bacterium]
MSFDEEPDHIPTKEEYESAMLVSDALAIIRQAAIDGRLSVDSIIDFTDELMGFVLQQVNSRPDMIDLNPDPLGNG